MPIITKKVIEFATLAYRQLKDKDDEAVFYKLSSGDNNYRWVEYMMVKRCWYNGNYAIFERGSYICRFSKEVLESFQPKEEILKPSKTNEDEYK